MLAGGLNSFFIYLQVLAPQQLTSTIYLVYTIGSIVNTANELVLNILCVNCDVPFLCLKTHASRHD